jgi:hypothetical protein
MSRPKLDLSDPKQFSPEQRFLLGCVGRFLESVGHREEFVGFAAHLLMAAVPQWRERPAVLGAAVGRTSRMVQYIRDKTPETFLADLRRERDKTGPEPTLKPAQIPVIAEFLLAQAWPTARDLQAWLRSGPLQVEISVAHLYEFLRAHGLNHLLSRNRGLDKKKSSES